ncbi:MAG: FAD-dependent oxidoreductase [Gemmatimonadaceae bacterium]
MKDVLIIGSGAGGATLAFSLSRAGFDVVVLEKGPRYERSDYRHDELLMGKQSSFFIPSLDDEPHVLVNHSVRDAKPELTRVVCRDLCRIGDGARLS